MNSLVFAEVYLHISDLKHHVVLESGTADAIYCAQRDRSKKFRRARQHTAAFAGAGLAQMKGPHV